MGLLGAIVGGTLGFVLGGPLGMLLGGALGSRLSDPSPQDLGAYPPPPPPPPPGAGRAGAGPGTGSRGTGPWAWQERLFGRCPRCSAFLEFTPGQPLVCPRCSARLRADIGAGPFAGGGWGAGAGAGTAEDLDQGTAQSAFMVALIGLAARLAKADGRVSEQEIEAFDRFLREEAGMPASERQLAARIFNRARDDATPTAAYTAQIRALLGHRPDRLRDLVALLLRVGYADGRLEAGEERLIRQINADLGLSARDFENALALFKRDDIGAAYALLEVDRGATNDEIKKSYRRLAKEYHPDVLQSRGLPEDFLKFANEKLQAINAAYARVKQERGF